MIRLVFFLLIFLSGTPLDAQTLQLRDQEAYRMMPYYDYSVVEDMNDTPLQAQKQSWIRDRSALVVDPNEQAYWIHFTLQNTAPHPQDLYLSAERNYVYSMEYYLIKNGAVAYQEREIVFKHE